MQKLSATASSIPLIKCISRRTNIPPEYVALVMAAVCFVIIQRTPLGPIFANLVSAAFLLKDAMLTLRQPAPRVADLRKNVVALVVFVVFVALENLGIGALVPLFGILKVGVLVWVGASNQNAELVDRALLARVPDDFLQYGNEIELAVKKAAKAVERKASEAKAGDSKSTASEDRKTQ